MNLASRVASAPHDTSYPLEGGGGTLVKMDDLESIKPPCIKAITMRYDQFLITIKSLKMIDNHEFIKNIFSILADHKMSIDLISTSEVSVAFTIDGTRMGLQSINPFIIDSKLLSELDQISEIIVEEW